MTLNIYRIILLFEKEYLVHVKEYVPCSDFIALNSSHVSYSVFTENNKALYTA